MNKTYKVLLVGNQGVGKSALLHRLITDAFNQKYIPTVGVEVHPIVRDNICYNFWDIAGMEKFKGLGAGYYVEAHIAIVMCDNTSKLSFKSVDKYVSQLREINPNIPILFVTNKMDVQTLGLIPDSINISVKDNIGINDIFTKMKSMLDKRKEAITTQIRQLLDELDNLQ